MDNYRKALTTSNRINGVDPMRLRPLLKNFGEPKKILSVSRANLERIHGIRLELANSTVNWGKSVDLSCKLKHIEKFGCKIVIQADGNAPEHLTPVHSLHKGELLPKDKIALPAWKTASRLYFQIT